MAKKTTSRRTSKKTEPPDSRELQRIRVLERRLHESQVVCRRELALRELAEQDLKDAEKRLDAALKTSRTKKPRAIRRKRRRGKGSATGVVCLTDWHCEETVEKETVNGLNEFNLTIARQRIERTFRKSLCMLNFAREISDIRELVVWLGGDFISGYIHEELEEGNSLSPIQAVNWVQDEIARGLTFLAENSNVDKIRVPTSYGNHARTTKRTRIATRHKNSYEWLMYMQLQRQMQASCGDLFEFDISPGYHTIIDIHGYPTRFHHGDGMRYQGGVGGITIPVNKAIAAWNKSRTCAYDFFGHWHQFMENWSWVSVGCLIGYSPFALEIKADYQPPTQAFSVIDQEYGKVLAVPVFCDRPMV